MTQSPTNKTTLFGMELGVDITPLTKKILEFRRKISKRNLLLEFGNKSLNYAESKYSDKSIIFTKVEKAELDEKAIEKGSPTDPKQMSNFLKQIINEDNIVATRTAVVIPPEAAFNKTIYLPENILPEDARGYILDPKSGFHFPIPIKNTDFDLTPLNIFRKKNNKAENAFFLTSIPKKITDNLIETLALTGLELVRLEIAYTSQFRLLYDEIKSLNFDEYVILLELTNECTYVSIISNSSIIEVDRIAAIREYPFFNRNSNKVEMENYLPISYLDLRILINELSEKIRYLRTRFGKNIIKSIYLSGTNSSHKGIEVIIGEKLKTKTILSNPYSSKEIGDINNNTNIHIQSLNRLIGLGLGILPMEIKQRDKKISSKKLEEINQSKSNYSTEVRKLNKMKNTQEEYINDKKDSINLFPKKIKINDQNLNDKNSIKDESNLINKTNTIYPAITSSTDQLDFKEEKVEKIKLTKNNLNSENISSKKFKTEENWPSINDKESIINTSIPQEEIKDNNQNLNDKNKIKDESNLINQTNPIYPAITSSTDQLDLKEVKVEEIKLTKNRSKSENISSKKSETEEKLPNINVTTKIINTSIPQEEIKKNDQNLNDKNIDKKIDNRDTVNNVNKGNIDKQKPKSKDEIDFDMPDI